MLLFISSDQEDKWNDVVKNFKQYDVYYLLEYAKAFQVHGDGDPLLVYYEDADFKAINVVMKRDISKDERFQTKIPKNKYFDITTPYGYGGFLIEGETTTDSILKLKHKYEKKCKNEGIVSEFVRFHPILNNSILLDDIYDINSLGKTISINLEDKEHIWSNFTGKNRNVIRKSLKNEVKIYWGQSPELMNKFTDLYNVTMERDNAKDYYYFNNGFYNSVLYDLKYKSMLFYAVYKDEIISMSMILFENDQMHYHLSASNREYQSLASTNLLLYEAALWGVENNYRTLHLGGGLGGMEDNLYKFKKAFNKVSDNNFFIGKKIFDNEKYDYLYNIHKDNETSDINQHFFPIYRG